MAKRLTVLSLLSVLVSSAVLVSGTFTHPDDLHFEARVPKSVLIGAAEVGTHTMTALPIGLSNGHRVDPYAPEDEAYYSGGYTDEHHKPRIDFKVENGALVKVSVSFPAPFTLAMPAFTAKVLTARADHTIPDKYYRAKRQRTIAEDSHDENEGLSFDERKHEMIMEETLVTPNAQSEAANFALHDPTPMEDLYDYVVVIINVHPRVITSFVYELEGIPDEMLKSDKMFDLTPFNSTMHMKFVAKYDPKEDALGIWVVRRPPIPDFTVLMSVDGRLEMSQNVAEPSPSGQGFPTAIAHASSRRTALFRFVVHFYERPRQHHVCFPLQKDFIAAVDGQLAGTHNHRKFIEQAIPSLEGFGVRFTNDNHRDALTVSVVQASPISSLMVSLYASYDGAKVPQTLRHGNASASEDVAERPILIFREEEHHVPFIAPTEPSQFGWYNALPMKGDALVRLADARSEGKASRVPSKKIKISGDGDGEDDTNYDDVEEELAPIPAARVAKLHLSACVSYNDKEGHMHPFEEMGEWIDDFGGSTRRMTVMTRPKGAVGTQSRQGRHTKADQGLAAREEVAVGEEIGSIPYRVLLTTVTVEGNEWVREVMKNATAFVTKCVELGMDVQQNQHFMLMTFFLLMQPSSVYDGTNWRQYFDTIPLDSKPSIPIFMSEAELSQFAFTPLMAEHVRTMKELIDAEYRTIVAQVPWFEEEVTVEKYAIARSQVENRVFNISGTLVMIPALDYLAHSDDPSVSLSFDDREQYVRLQARRAIPSGGPLSIDYGIEARSKFDFLTQFGFIPRGAASVAGLRILRYKSTAAASGAANSGDAAAADEFSNVFLLATVRDSRSELVTLLREDLAAAKSDKEGDEVEAAMITQSEVRTAFLALLKKELAAMPVRDAIKADITAAVGDAEGKDRAEGLAEMARTLYDGHRLALEQHIQWASDVKVPL